MLLFKALITADGVLKRLDRQFDIVATLKPLIQAQVARRYTDYASRRRLMQLGSQVLDSSQSLPQTLRLILRRLRHGRLQADIALTNLDKLGKSLESAAATLAIAIVTAAFALALAPWLMNSDVRILGIPLFPLLGAGCFFFGAGWLLWRLRGK